MKRCRFSFTLVELVVATMLMAMVGLIIGTSLSAFQKSLTKTQRLADKLERLQAIDRLAETALKSAIPFTWPDQEENEEKVVFEGETETLWLTAMNRAYGADGAFRFIRLYAEDGVFYCDYSTRPFLPWLDLESQHYETEVIASGVQEISFKYAIYDENNELTWYDLWDEDEQAGKFPLAIQLTVVWEDGTSERWLRRTAGTSTNTEYLTGTDISN